MPQRKDSAEAKVEEKGRSAFSLRAFSFVIFNHNCASPVVVAAPITLTIGSIHGNRSVIGSIKGDVGRVDDVVGHVRKAVDKGPNPELGNECERRHEDGDRQDSPVVLSAEPVEELNHCDDNDP